MLMLRDERHLPASIWNESFGVAFSMFGGLVKMPLKAIKVWYEREQLRDHLMRMTDRQLDDIGVSRDEIESIARGTYRRAPTHEIRATLVALALAEARARQMHALPANDDRNALAA